MNIYCKIKAEANFAHEEDGTPAEAYLCLKFNGSPEIPDMQHKVTPEDVHRFVEASVGMKLTFGSDMLEMISEQEYLENTDEDDEDSQDISETTN